MSLTRLFLTELVEGDDLRRFFAVLGGGDDLGFRLGFGGSCGAISGASNCRANCTDGS
jgi:dihydrodipicolinate synthase/N-acetylneuraminate lyase